MLLTIEAYDGENQESPLNIIRACLATTDAEGCLLSVGRRIGNLLLENDKSVSREHFILRAVSVNKTLQRPLEQNGKVVTGIPVPPRTREEKDACTKAKDHTCIVLENKGKLGTFILDNTEENKIPAKAVDHSEDETDEDEPATSPQIVTNAGVGIVSEVTKKHAKDVQKISFKTLLSNESTVLTNLNEEGGMTVLQCGKLGSTLVVRRHSLRVVRSGEHKKGDTALTPYLFATGVEEQSSIDDSTTHVVTDQRNTTSKQLLAWLKGIPIVNNAFLQSLLDRQSPTDPIPNEIDFEPKTDNRLFWKNQPNPRLWAGATFLSGKNDEMECLVRAAGANVVRLYECPDGDSINIAKNTPHCFVLADRKKRTKQLKDLGVLTIPSKQLAELLTKQERLKTSGGDVVGSSIPDFSGDHAKSTEHRAILSPPTLDNNNPGTLNDDFEPTESPQKDEVERADTKQSVSKKRPHSSTESRKGQPEKKSRSDSQEECFDTGETDHNSSKDALLGQGKVPVDERLRGSPVTKKGWLQTFPKGNARERFARSREEIRETAGYDDIYDVAPTDTCKGLIVKNGPPQRRRISTNKSIGQDFKRFRKNHVPGGTVPRIHLRPYLPDESEKLRDLEEQRRALEEQQRKADELFQEPIARAAAGRQRRR